MIERFNEVPRRDSAIIYGSSLEQIQQYYEMDPAAAGELAISIIELALTGQMSTNNPLIKMALANFKDVAVKNTKKYEKKKEAELEKRIEKLQLREIADMLNRGIKQKEIAEHFHRGASTISDRIKVLKTEFPELLTENSEKNSDSDEVRPNSENLNEIRANSDEIRKNTEFKTNSEIRVNSTNLSQRFPKNSENSSNSEYDNVNVNVNVNDTVHSVSSNEETSLETISLSKLNEMGAQDYTIEEGIVTFSTGVKMRVLYDF